MLGTCKSSKETHVPGADEQVESSKRSSHSGDRSTLHKVLLCHPKTFGFTLSETGCHCKIWSRGMT